MFREYLSACLGAVYLRRRLMQDRPMGARRIILLTGESEASPLAEILRNADPRMHINTVISATQLHDVFATSQRGARLLSFCSPVIVPAAMLEDLGGPAYNFHPGPPDYPGRYPSVFALYAGATRFGITVHEMVRQVDAGPIVAAEWFVVPENCDLATLEQLAFIELAGKFRQLAPLLVDLERPLPRMPYRWSGKRTSRADCERLCQITPGLSDREIELLRRACGSFLKEP